MVVGELLLEFLSSLGSWAFADLFRKPALRLTLAVHPDELAMTTKTGEEVFRLGSRLNFTRDRDGTPQLLALGGFTAGACREDMEQIPLSDLLESSELDQSDVKALLGALLDVCDNKARERLALPKDRRVRVNICLQQDLEFAGRGFAAASLERARNAMKRQIPQLTSFHIQRR